jgi:hypothetical protein
MRKENKGKTEGKAKKGYVVKNGKKKWQRKAEDTSGTEYIYEYAFLFLSSWRPSGNGPNTAYEYEYRSTGEQRAVTTGRRSLYPSLGAMGSVSDLVGASGRQKGKILEASLTASISAILMRLHDRLGLALITRKAHDSAKVL